MKQKKKFRKMYKVIYFDEDSAGDYLNIENNGIQTTRDEQENKRTFIWTLTGNVTLNIILAIALLIGLAGLLLIGEDISKVIFGVASIVSGLGITITSSNIETQLKQSEFQKRLIMTQVKSTVLTQFLMVQRKDGRIHKIKSHKIIFPTNSFTYMKSLSPILGLMKEGHLTELPFNITKLGDFIDDLKGYYSVLAENSNGEKKILRFNSKGFRNNYRLSDLLVMDLSFYAVEVGKIESGEDMLSLDSEFAQNNDRSSSALKDKISGITEKESNEVILYDVLLAAVNSK